MKRILITLTIAILLTCLFASTASAAMKIVDSQYRLEVTLWDGVLTGAGTVPVSVGIDNDDSGWYRLRNVVIRLPDGQVIRKDTVAGWSGYTTDILNMWVSDSTFREKSFTVTVSYDLHQSHNDVFLEHKTESVTLRFQTAPNQLVKSVMELFSGLFGGIGKLFMVILFIGVVVAALGGGGDVIEIFIG